MTITRERRPIIAAFLANALEDPVLLEGGLRFRRSVEERLSALFLTRRDEMTHPDPALAIDLAIQTAFAIMQQHVLIEETRAQGRALTDDELRRELTTLVLRYVGIEPRRRRTRARLSGGNDAVHPAQPAAAAEAAVPPTSR